MAKPTGVTGVQETADGRLQISFRHGPRPGKTYRWKLDIPATAGGIAEAAGVLDERRSRVKAGLPPIARESDNPSVAEAAVLWANEMIAQLKQPEPSLAKRTVNGYIADLERVWLPTIGSLKINMLRFSDLRTIDNTRTWTSNKTRRNARLAVRRFLDWALQGDLIDSNPALKFQKLRVRKREVKAYSLDEATKLVGWLRENAPDDPALYFGLGFDTGIRPGEMIALTWQMFDGHGFDVSVGMSSGELGDTKTHKARYVPVSEGMKRWLTSHRAKHMAMGEPNGHIIRNQYGRPYQRPSKLNIWFHRGCAGAELPDYLNKHSPYPYRKSFVTGLYESTMHPQDASQIAGHTRKTAEGHYVAQTAKERLRKARREM